MPTHDRVGLHDDQGPQGHSSPGMALACARRHSPASIRRRKEVGGTEKIGGDGMGVVFKAERYHAPKSQRQLTLAFHAPIHVGGQIMLAARRPLVVVAVLAFVALAASASAQQGGVSAIAGIVRDTSGAVLPGATVQAASPVLIEKVREVVTDEQGQYKIVNLPLGTYSVTVSLPGFKSVQRAGIELTTNFTAPVNAQLEVGSVEETLTVSGTAPVVDVQNAATRNIISAKVLDTIPTGKTMLTIIAVTPGMAGNTAGQDVGGSKGDLMPFFSFHGSNQADSH